MKSLLIKDTAKEEEKAIVAESLGNIEGGCDGCAPGILEMYQPYIDGKDGAARMQYGIQSTLCFGRRTAGQKRLWICQVSNMIIYQYGEQAAENVLIQLVGEHDLPALGTKSERYRK